jgi:hypothetical protein
MIMEDEEEESLLMEARYQVPHPVKRGQVEREGVFSLGILKCVELN